MAAVGVAVRPFPAGVLPRCAATAPFDATERVSGKKRPRHGVAPPRDSAACLTKIISSRNSVVTAAGEMSSHELLQKRLASELGALRGLLKKAELISQRGACNGGAPTAGKKDRFLASNQRAKPIEEGFNAPLVKRRKISTPVEQKQKQIPAPPRMSPEERNQLACRLSSLSGKLPGHIVEFMEKQFGDADSHGEVEINMDTVEDSVLFELKTLLDKFAEESKNRKVAEESKSRKVAEESKDDKFAKESHNKKGAEESKDDKFAEESKNKKVAEESKNEKVAEESKNKKVAEESKDDKVAEEDKGKKEAEEYADISIGLSCITDISIGSKPSSSCSGGSGTRMVQQSFEAKKVQDAQQRAAPKAVDMRGLLYRANLRRQLLEMEKTVVPDQRIHPRDLQRLRIEEYGHPRIMRHLGLVLKVVEA